MRARRDFLIKAAGWTAAGFGLSGSQAASAGAGKPAPSEMVSLAGSAHEVGKRFGQLNAADIRCHMETLLSSWRERGLTESEMVRRSEPFLRFVKKFAPAWEDELAGAAEGAGVEPDRYIAFQAGKYRDLFFFQDECTSFLAVGEATADGATLFHKNRDNTARRQCAYRKAVRHASNPAAFHATGDTSDLSAMMMVNEHGLAGSADMGGLPVKQPRGRGVMNPYILRLIAERAERCEDALEIIQRMIRDRWYAGGNRTGTHWLFADRHGKGLRVAQNSTEEKHWFFEDDVAFLARGNTPGARLVTEKKGKITVGDMNAAASHPSICFTSSVSAMTTRIDPERPGALSSVWFALPAWSTYLPLFPLAEGVPRDVLAGDYYAAGRQLLRWMTQKVGFGRGASFDEGLARQLRLQQDALYAEADRWEAKIRAALARGAKTKAVELATEGTIACSDNVMQFLRQVTRKNEEVS